MTRVVIAGGGIAGLSIAHALVHAAPETDVIVLEARARPGGNIRSERIDGYLCEAGPDGFLDSAPATLALIDAVGLRSRLLRSRDEARRRFIYRAGRLHEVPPSAGAFLKSGLLSTKGKARLLWEPLARRRPEGDESIHEFAARRLGPEAARVMIDPMVSGIFAGDARALSLRACFPKMWHMETAHGGLFRAMLARRRRGGRAGTPGAPAGTLTSFTDGMEDLVRGLLDSLGERVRTATPLTALRERTRTVAGPRRVGARAFSVIAGDEPIEADAIVLAGPSVDSAEVVRPFDPALASALAAISGAPLAVVCLGYDAAALAADRGPLDGFGFLAPRGEGVRILGALWETSIYDGRAPAGRALLRVMIGGATDPDAVELDESRLLARARTDLGRTMGIRIGPEFVHIVRHRRGIPQYTIGHDARVAEIETMLRRHPGLFVAGNSYRTPSINACIEAAAPLAAGIVEHLRTTIASTCGVEYPAAEKRIS
jgi:oxygen-dependent protoporphyrinogen oxidase